MAKKTNSTTDDKEKPVGDLVSNDIAQKLSTQFVHHLSQSRRHKKPRIDSWKRVDDMMANRKIEFADTTVHVPLGKARGFLRRWLSKIDNPLTFKYKHKEPADIKKARNLNAIRETDQNVGRWNWKDLMGKTQAGKYGRAIYFYTARSPKGEYESELSMIDVLRFHIDPRAGGEDKEKARWMGWSRVELTREELEQGRDDGEYYKEKVDTLLTAGGNASKKSLEDRYEDYRYTSINSTGKEAETPGEDLFTFYRWFETINNTRYSMLVTETGEVIQAKELEKEWASGLYPVWTWAGDTDPTEFWSLGEIEYQMYVFIAQEASISQMIENSDKVNKPQRAVNIERIKNLAQVKYRRDSFIEVEGDDDVNKAIKDMPVPSIQTPMVVYDKLDLVQADATGMTAGTKGMAEEDKVAIYEGNMQQVGDIFGLLNKSYAEGYYHFARLHEAGVYENLTKSMAVEIMGEQGLSLEKVSRKDIKSKKGFNILIESSNAESQSNNVDRKNKTTFLAGYKGDQMVNQKVLFEQGAKNVGYEDDEVKRFLDTSDYATSEIISDAHEVFQQLVSGKEADPYDGANTVWLQEILKLYWKNRSDLNAIQATTIEQYIESHIPIVEQNMARDLTNKLSEQGAIDPSQTGAGNLAKLGMGLEDPNAVDGALDITNKEGVVTP